MNREMEHPYNDIDPELLVRFLSGECSEQERLSIAQWLEADPKNRIYFKELSALWNASAPSSSFNKEWLKDDWKKVQHRIDKIRVNESSKTTKQRSLLYTFARLAAVIILGIGIYFYTQHLVSRVPAQKTIASSGVKILTLPDGSKISLNDNATLTYPKIFNQASRDVTLDGEAFFEITADMNKPFLIKTNKVITEVVGTSFNVNSNSDSVVVTVVTGKVMLYRERNSAIALTVGEQGIYSDKGLTKRMNSDPNFLSWKTNILTFQNTPLAKVVDDLSRHYGQHIQITSKMLEGCTLTSTFQGQTLEEILQEMTLLFSIEVDRSGDTIMIRGKGC